MLSNWYIAFAIFLLGFGFLVFIHELGHFLVAKMVGIRCSQFAVCFGNALLSYRKGIGLRVGSTEPEYRKLAMEQLKKQGKYKGEDTDPNDVMKAADELGLGETEYRLNSIPLGGYVKMVGQEDLDPNARSDDPRAYNNKPVGARLAVISAGVIMNIITGFVFFIIAFMIGVKFPAAVVGETLAGSPAAKTFAEAHDGDAKYMGLQPGDRIVSIDDGQVRDMLDVKMATALASIGSTLEFKVERAGYDQPLTYRITPEYDDELGLMFSGISPASTLIVAATSDTPALTGTGVKDKMVITAVDGQPVENYWQFIERLEENPAQPKQVTFSPGEGQTGEPITVTIESSPTLASTGEKQPRNLLGLVPAVTIREVVSDSPAEAAGMQKGDVLKQVGDLIWPISRDDIINEVKGAGSDGVLFKVMRGDEIVDLGKIVPEKSRVGIAMGFGGTTLAEVVPDSAVAGLRLSPGTQVTAVNGTPVESWSQVQDLLKTSLAGAADSDTSQGVELTYKLNVVGRPIETATVEVTPKQATQIAMAGWVPPLVMETMRTNLQAAGPVEATMLGVEKTNQFMIQTYMTLLRLFQGSVSPTNLNGPVGIVQHGTTFTTRGLGYLLFFLGLISINLAVLNFLPMPIVDGGHAVFLIYEKITGKPPGERFQTVSMLVGLILLGGVFIFVTYNDILKIVTGA